MIFGYNTDVKSGEVVYHVQTEDRGEKNPVIDSVIYVKGRIVDRRRTPYNPAATTPERLQEMVKQQHRELVEAIRSGTYVMPEEPPPAAPAPAPLLELSNARGIQQAGQLVFRLRVRDRSSGQPLAGSLVQALVSPGEPDEMRCQATVDADGTAEIRLQAVYKEGTAVLFRATAAGAAEVLKYRLVREEIE